MNNQKLHTGPRETGLGGSDVAAILGDNPYMSAHDLWLDKTRRLPKAFEENKYTLWGKLKEGLIAQHYATVHGVRLLESPRRVHPTIPHLYFSPDRLICAVEDVSMNRWDPISQTYLMPRGLEIKTGLAKHARKWRIPDRIVIEDRAHATETVPLYYWDQCQTYMDGMGFPEWDLVVLLDSSEFRQYRLRWDKEWCADALTRASRWFKTHVIDGLPPAPDWGANTNRYLSMMFPDSNGTILVADQDQSSMMDELAEHDEEAAGLETKLEEFTEETRSLDRESRAVKESLDRVGRAKSDLEARLKAIIGTNLGIRSANGKELKWSPTKKTRRMWKSWRRRTKEEEGDA